MNDKVTDCRFGENKYIPELKKMWKLCFPSDSDIFIDFYFEKVYKNEETLVIVEENKPVASMQIIPYPIKINQRISQAGYISGAMTHPDFRRRGYMENLLIKSFDFMKEKEYVYAFLIPQEKWLFDFYAKYGYKPAFPTNTEILSTSSFPEISENKILRDREIHVFDSLKNIVIDDFFTTYYRFLMEKNPVILKTKQQTEKILEDLFISNGILFMNDWGIALTTEEEGEVFIKEFFYFDSEIKTDFLKVISAFYKVEKIICRTYNPSDSSVFRGMINSLNNSQPPENIYMNMMLD